MGKRGESGREEPYPSKTQKFRSYIRKTEDLGFRGGDLEEFLVFFCFDIAMGGKIVPINKRIHKFKGEGGQERGSVI